MSKAVFGKLSSLLSKIKNRNKLHYILIALICVILAILFCFNVSDKESTKKSVDEINAEIYVNNLEKKLSKTLSQVDGAGKVSVIITVESGMETVVAKKVTTVETSEGLKTEETPVIINGKIVILKELYPKIIGVLIVTEGGNNISVISKIQNATVSLLDININQIEILTMK